MTPDSSSLGRLHWWSWISMESAASIVWLTKVSAVTPRISCQNLSRLLLALSGYDASWTQSKHPLFTVLAFCPATETLNNYSWLLNFQLSFMQSHSRAVFQRIKIRRAESLIQGRRFREFGWVRASCANLRSKGWFWWRRLRCWV